MTGVVVGRAGQHFLAVSAVIVVGRLLCCGGKVRIERVMNGAMMRALKTQECCRLLPGAAAACIHKAARTTQRVAVFLPQLQARIA